MYDEEFRNCKECNAAFKIEFSSLSYRCFVCEHNYFGKCIVITLSIITIISFQFKILIYVSLFLLLLTAWSLFQVFSDSFKIRENHRLRNWTRCSCGHIGPHSLDEHLMREIHET